MLISLLANCYSRVCSCADTCEGFWCSFSDYIGKKIYFSLEISDLFSSWANGDWLITCRLSIVFILSQFAPPH